MLSVKFCVKTAHPQHVDVAPIQNIACVEDDHLQTDVHFASSGIDVIDQHEVL
jgi:hypothetical protein